MQSYVISLDKELKRMEYKGNTKKVISLASALSSEDPQPIASSKSLDKNGSTPSQQGRQCCENSHSQVSKSDDKGDRCKKKLATARSMGEFGKKV